MKPYEAAFLISTFTDKVLEEIGWSFKTAGRLPSKTVGEVIQALWLRFKETYDATMVFEGNGIKETILHDENGLAEQIYFQLFGRSVKERQGHLPQRHLEDMELFVP